MEEATIEMTVSLSRQELHDVKTEMFRAISQSLNPQTQMQTGQSFRAFCAQQAGSIMTFCKMYRAADAAMKVLDEKAFYASEEGQQLLERMNHPQAGPS